jgi:NADH-quinone oxidoreductase subunit M
MFQRVFLGPVTNEDTKKLRDLNRRELAIMLAFVLFIFWIGIAPSGYFGLMDTSVSQLVADISSSVVAMP